MRRSMTLAWVLLVFTVVTVARFQCEVVRRNRPNRRGRNRAPVRQSVSKPAVEESASRRRIAERSPQQVVEAIRTGKLSALNDLIDWESLFSKTMKGLEVTPKLRQDIDFGTQERVESGNGAFGPDRQEFADRRHFRLSEGSRRQEPAGDPVQADSFCGVRRRGVLRVYAGKIG